MREVKFNESVKNYSVLQDRNGKHRRIFKDGRKRLYYTGKWVLAFFSLRDKFVQDILWGALLELCKKVSMDLL